MSIADIREYCVLMGIADIPRMVTVLKEMEAEAIQIHNEELEKKG